MKVIPNMSKGISGFLPCLLASVYTERPIKINRTIEKSLNGLI